MGVSAGLLAYPPRRFVLFAALGALLWTTYGVALAFLGQAVFHGNTWAGVLLAVGIAVGTGALVQAVRSLRRGREPHR